MRNIVFFCFFFFASFGWLGSAFAQPDHAAQRQRTEEARKEYYREGKPSLKLATPSERREAALSAAKKAVAEEVSSALDKAEEIARPIGRAVGLTISFFVGLSLSLSIIALFSGAMFKRWELFLEGTALVIVGLGLLYYDVLSPLGVEDMVVCLGVIAPGVILIVLSFFIQDTWLKIPLVFAVFIWALVRTFLSLWALINRSLAEGNLLLLVGLLGLLIGLLAARRGQAAAEKGG